MKKIILLLTVLLQVTLAFSQYFKVGYTGDNPNDAMNIFVTNADIGGVNLQAGDEIAVFDGNLCCGVVVLTQPASLSTLVEIKASADNAGSNDGFKSGNKIYFRFWVGGIEYTNVIPTFEVGPTYSDVFQNSGSAVVSLSTGNTTRTWTGALGFGIWDIANNWSPMSVPEPNSDVIIPSGAVQPIIFSTQKAYCGNLTFQSNPTLTVNSDGLGTGSLIVTNSINGAATINSQRYITGNAWHMVSSPLSGQSLSGFLAANGAIPTRPDGITRGMMEYNVSDDNWNDFFTNNTPELVTPGNGYSVRTTADNVVTFTGNLTNSEINVPVTNSGNGWNLVGNPFTSAMYLQQEVFGFLVENAAMLDDAFKGIFLWDPAASGGLGAYSAVGLDEGQANLASGQGFFIKAASIGNVTFTKQMQVHETGASFKSATISKPSIVLNVNAGDISSSTKISFNEERTLGLDPGYDLGLLRNGHGFDIYSRLITDNGVDFMVQSLPGKTGDSYVIPIGLDAVKGGEVVFSASALNLPVSYDVMIEDKLTNSVADLKNDGLYVAELIANNKGIGRFYLHVGSSVQTAIKEIRQNELVVYNIGQTTYIKGNVSNNAQFLVYSIDGRLVNRFSATSQNLNQINTAGFTPGVYFVNVQDVNKYKPVKFVVGK